MTGQQLYANMPGLQRATEALAQMAWVYGDHLAGPVSDGRRAPVEELVIDALGELQRGVNEMLAPINKALGYAEGLEVDLDRPWRPTNGDGE